MSKMITFTQTKRFTVVVPDSFNEAKLNTPEGVDEVYFSKDRVELSLECKYVLVSVRQLRDNHSKPDHETPLPVKR